MVVVVLHYCLAVVLLWQMDGAIALVHSQSPFVAPEKKKKKIVIMTVVLLLMRGRRWRSWLRHCATSRKVAGSIPDGVIGFFH